MEPTPHEIEGIALLARAEAEAAAIRGRAEVDARAVLAEADADAVAVRGRAELDAAEVRRGADADREQARLVLEEARRRAAELVAEAEDLRRQTERTTLDRLLATRADLHDAIERLTEMTEPVLDLTDGGPETVGGASALHLAPIDDLADDSGGSGSGGDEADDGTGNDGATVGGPPSASEDPVEALVRSAIGRAVDSATAPGRPQPFATERPSRRREQLRDGRNVL